MKLLFNFSVEILLDKRYPTLRGFGLSERDYETRTNLSRDILQSIPPTSVTICSDEAHFHLSGMVNKQKFRYWSQNNPRELHQRPLHSPKVTVWCAMGSFGVLTFLKRRCYSDCYIRPLLVNAREVSLSKSCLLIMNPMMYSHVAYLSTFTRNPAGHVSKSCYFSAG